MSRNENDDSRPLSRDRLRKERWYPEVRFGDITRVDGTVAFYTRVNSLLRDDSVVLDLGCGRGASSDDVVPWRRALRDLRAPGRRVVGVDVDPAAAGNPTIDEFRLIEGDRLPAEDSTFNLVVADWVLEHVEDVDGLFAEVVRVLRPGGTVCIRTPNVWNYMGVAARLIPDRLHNRVLSRVQPDRLEEDIFPTVYRCNTVGALTKAFRRHGLDGVVIAHESEPAYLSVSGTLYALGVAYQRLAPRRLRHSLLAFARKPVRTST